jgi:uncharacterized RDD family membrane protein YckC
VNVASFPSRVLAGLIDVLVIGAATGLVLAPALLLGRDTDLIAVPVLLLVAAAYFPLTMRSAGQTWGKRVARIRVVRADGRPLDTGTVIVRDVVGKTGIFTVLAVIALFVPTLVNFAWPLFDKRRQALHDKMAQTLVVSSG